METSRAEDFTSMVGRLSAVLTASLSGDEVWSVMQEPLQVFRCKPWYCPMRGVRLPVVQRSRRFPSSKCRTGYSLMELCAAPAGQPSVSRTIEQ
jgi:hypothetical protein